MFMLSNGKLYVRCNFVRNIVEAAEFIGTCIVTGTAVCIAAGTFKVFCKILEI